MTIQVDSRSLIEIEPNWLIRIVQTLFIFSFAEYLLFQFISQETPEQQHTIQNNAAMELINSVTGVDDEGRSRQRVLTFAARRYNLIILQFLLFILVGNSMTLKRLNANMQLNYRTKSLA